jgi:hypothetical protein
VFHVPGISTDVPSPFVITHCVPFPSTLFLNSSNSALDTINVLPLIGPFIKPNLAIVELNPVLKPTITRPLSNASASNSKTLPEPDPESYVPERVSTEFIY